jgi:hypothetical protein
VKTLSSRVPKGAPSKSPKSVISLDHNGAGEGNLDDLISASPGQRFFGPGCCKSGMLYPLVRVAMKVLTCLPYYLGDHQVFLNPGDPGRPQHRWRGVLPAAAP